MHTEFLKYSISRLKQSESRIEQCLDRLSDEQIWTRSAETENAIGNLVLHLCGNVGQWILSAVGGAPDVRDRDAEFAAKGDVSAGELKQRIRERVEDSIPVIETLTPEQLLEVVQVQSYDVTRLAAVYQVVTHFSEHAGQIYFATKLLTAEDLGFYGHLGRPARGRSAG